MTAHIRFALAVARDCVWFLCPFAVIMATGAIGFAVWG